MQYSEKEYLDALFGKTEGIRKGEDPDLYNKLIVIEHNKELISSYPWLSFNLNWNDDGTFSVSDKETFEHTWLDSMADGWRITFGLDMCYDIKQELKKFDYNNRYYITEIKEKFGVLDWFSGPVPVESKVYEIVKKYEDLSKHVCMECGKNTEWVLDDSYWVYYYCDDCKRKVEEESNFKFKRMED